MPDKTLLEVMQEAINEDLEVMREVIREDIMPLIAYQKQLEKEAFDRAYRELKELEKGELELEP